MAESAQNDPDSTFEKRFYLDEFRDRTLALAIAPEVEDAKAIEGLFSTVQDLVREGARLILLGPTWIGRHGTRFETLASEGRSGPPTSGRSIVLPESGRIEVATLRDVWSQLRESPIALLSVGDSPWSSIVDVAIDLTARLRAHKLVLADPEGGVGDGGPLSFLNGAVLETLLERGEAEWVGLASRRALISKIHGGLERGISSINLCRLDELARELFTYRGAGSLFTLQDYCRVDRLGIDDFPQVEALLRRGEREGFLKPRTADEIGDVLLTGYGANIGSGHLAGVASMLVYESDSVAEIAALYTVSRYQGEGVGERLVSRIVSDARARGLRRAFACTSERRAAEFFRRAGFRDGSSTDIPAEKWEGYPEDRRGGVIVLVMDLVRDGDGG